MKSQYIKPETKIVACTLLSVIAASNGTGWYVGDDPVGPEQPDPNADDAKQSPWEVEPDED